MPQAHFSEYRCRICGTYATMTSAVPAQPTIAHVKLTWLPLTKQTPVRSDLKPGRSNVYLVVPIMPRPGDPRPRLAPTGNAPATERVRAEQRLTPRRTYCRGKDKL